MTYTRKRDEVDGVSWKRHGKRPTANCTEGETISVLGSLYETRIRNLWSVEIETI